MTAKEILERIAVIEEKAREITEAAKKASAAQILAAKKEAEELIAVAENSSRRKALLAIEQAKQEAENEKQTIERDNQAAISDLRKKTAPKIEGAKKLCR